MSTRLLHLSPAAAWIPCLRASLRALVLGSAMLSALPGCERKGVEEQAIAKGVERIPAAKLGASSADAAVDVAGSGERPWAVPDGWREDREPRQMRLATYIAPDPTGPVEVAITRFGGRVGGALANINRWRGQMGLGPIGEDDLDESILRFSAAGFEGYEIQIESPRGVMLAAGMYEEAIDQMWFVRATVPNAEVAERLRADLFGLARSIAGLGDEGDD